MKKLNQILMTALVVSAAGFASVTSAEVASVMLVKPEQAVAPVPPRDRFTNHMNNMIERDLNQQKGIALQAMHEAPTSFESVNVGLEFSL